MPEPIPQVTPAPEPVPPALLSSLVPGAPASPLADLPTPAVGALHRTGQHPVPLADAPAPRARRGADRAAREAAERQAEWLARLQSVSAALVAAATPEEVARALATHAARALDAHSGLVAVMVDAFPGDEPTADAAALRILAAAGADLPPPGPWAAVPLAVDLPITRAARTGDWVWAVLDQDAPAPAGCDPRVAALVAGHDEVAVSATPLVVAGRVLGVLALGFPDDRQIDDAERALLAALTAQGASALERVRLATEERRARTQLDALFEASPAGLAFFDRELRYQRVNPALAAMNGGRTAADHLGRRPHEVAEMLGVLEPVLRRVLDTGQAVAGQEWDLLATAGRAWRASYYPVPGPDGRPLGVGVLTEEITAERLAARDREFLLDLSATLQRATDSAAVGAVALARTATRLSVARCALYEVDEAGRTAERRASWARPGSARPLARVRDPEFARFFPAVATGKILSVDDAGADPRTRDAYARRLAPLGVRSLCIVPLLRAGRLVAVLYAADDRPRRWTARERNLLRSVAERAWPAYATARLLEREQAARAEAEEARRVAEAANATKAQFLATMSHELRTPLNAIAGHAQLLEMEIHGPVTAAQREALARLQRSQQHLLALIDDVLHFARLESGRMEYHLEPLPLAEVAAEALRMIEPLAAARGVALEGPPAGDARLAWADREKVRQILVNLLGNAVKFTAAGGRVQVGVHRAPAPDADHAPERLAVAVHDSGCGIPRERLEDVFLPFVQVDAGLTRRSEGTGLGLAISRDLARGMGGDLVAESAPGVGSTFTLTLPTHGA